VPTFVAFDVAENFCVPAALPSQSVIGEINPHAGWRLWHQFLTGASQNVIAETKWFGCSPSRCGPKGWVQSSCFADPGLSMEPFRKRLGQNDPTDAGLSGTRATTVI
jgi:hypothetical protein